LPVVLQKKHGSWWQRRELGIACGVKVNGYSEGGPAAYAPLELPFNGVQ